MIFCQKSAEFYWSSNLTSAKDLVLELTGKHFSCSERNSWQSLGICPMIYFFGQILMHLLLRTIIVLRILSLKCQFENLAEIYIILLFNHYYAHLNLKSMLIPDLRFMDTQRFQINQQKRWCVRNPALGRRCHAKWLEKII